MLVTHLKTRLRPLFTIKNIAVIRKAVLAIQNSPTLTLPIHYPFVNILISSKYYHEPLPQKVEDILLMMQRESSLNQKTVLLQHLSDIINNHSGVALTHPQRTRVIKQLNQWKGRTGRTDKVATVAWVIQRLNLLKQVSQLYEQIANRFENDQWYTNLDESIKALEAFTELSNQQLKSYIYPRIQRIISKTIWQENMKMYQRVVVGLLESGRTESPLWDRLQEFILKNLGMEYSLKTIVDIFTSYALAGRGSEMFFQMVQKVIYLGHWYDYELKHKILPGYEQTGQFYALLVQTYSVVHASCQIHLLPDFLDFIYQGVANPKTNYQKLGSLTRLIQHLPGLFEREDQKDILKNMLQHKRPTSIAYPQMLEFYQLIKSKGMTLPESLHSHIEQTLILDIRRQLIPPSKVLQICEQLLQNGDVLDEPGLWEAVDYSITSRFQFMEGEEVKAVLHLSAMSKFMPIRTKQMLSLPGGVSK